MPRCPYCGKSFNISELRVHMETCPMKDKSDAVEPDVVELEPIEGESVSGDVKVEEIDVAKGVQEGYPEIPLDEPIADEELEKKAYTKVGIGKLLGPWEEELTARAKELGFDSLESYEKYKDELFKKSNKFGDLTIYPIKQDLLLGDFEYAVESPECMMSGMTDPIDFALGNFLPMRNRRGRFMGYSSRVQPEAVRMMVDPVFPSHCYAIDYNAVRQMVLSHGWSITPNGWVYVGKLRAQEET